MLTCISGYYGYIGKDERQQAVKSLTFHTSRGKFGPFGEEVGSFFTSTTTEGKVVGFHGRSSLYLDAIGVHMQHWLGSQRATRSSFFKLFWYETEELIKLGMEQYDSVNNQFWKSEILSTFPCLPFAWERMFGLINDAYHIISGYDISYSLSSKHHLVWSFYTSSILHPLHMLIKPSQTSWYCLWNVIKYIEWLFKCIKKSFQIG